MSATRVRGPVLSAEQSAAAHAGPQGAYLIAAGPGTGKTLTATERFCWLVDQGVAPERILTLTFSDRAAEELRLRIINELSARHPDVGTLDNVWIGTFHSACARLLDEFAYLIGEPREFCRRWKNQTEVTVPGSHFIQEDSGPAIGQAIGAWMKAHSL